MINKNKNINTSDKYTDEILEVNKTKTPKKYEMGKNTKINNKKILKI